MTNPEEVSRMMYEALKLLRGSPTDPFARDEASLAIHKYEQSITVDLESEK